MFWGGCSLISVSVEREGVGDTEQVFFLFSSVVTSWNAAALGFGSTVSCNHCSDQINH